MDSESVLKLDVHNHTWYSPDSITSPSQFIKNSKKQGVVLAVTEHGNAKSWSSLTKESKLHQWPFICGQEQRVYWDKAFAGELIGLFLNKPLKQSGVLETIDEIHDQGGLVVIPHPFDNRSFGQSRKFLRIEEIIRKIDVVEVFNARIRQSERNDQALDFAMNQKKPFSVGSDAHLPWEISNCHLEVDADSIEDCPKALLKNKGVRSIHRTHPVNLMATGFFRFPPLRKWITRKREL